MTQTNPTATTWPPQQIRDEINELVASTNHQRSLHPQIAKIWARHHDQTFSRWLDEECLISAELQQVIADLRRSFNAWCDQNDEPERSPNSFAQELKKRGFTLARAQGARVCRGLCLRAAAG
jgi:DNA replication initiation complex subunit (GINS family)